ncbi:LysR family transcriptional regulator [Limnohabitans sp. B9-3]|uniref:LysR family transcriptional regulator n=1 Tax=Limnohabitans sp. B9-3 TaxID=1100707 RepID=UPI000C1EFB9C|nr:LysR family transcriptional regulator [Limnohabitans sp. B9-3]PIT78568.1 LysR family transcriptional regulator [Limnohabitans sp. B9-3]
MTLVQLKHLIELATSGSFSQAASKLYLTQPALSRSIKALEDELGQPLFDRVGRKNELTAFGAHIVQRARVLVDEANELRQTSLQLKKGEIGQFRIGLGSGPGAMLMTPLLMMMATEHPQAHIDISRGSTALLVQALRERTLDALVLDIRSLKPATDLKIEAMQEMKGTFMCSRGHPLAKNRKVSFAQLRDYPIASTPLSDEVARLLIEKFGAEAHPDTLVNLRCEEISSLLDVARTSDAIVLAIRASAPDLVEIDLSPALNANARFGLITMASRTEPPLLSKVRALMQQVMKD